MLLVASTVQNRPSLFLQRKFATENMNYVDVCAMRENRSMWQKHCAHFSILLSRSSFSTTLDVKMISSVFTKRKDLFFCLLFADSKEPVMRPKVHLSHLSRNTYPFERIEALRSLPQNLPDRDIGLQMVLELGKRLWYSSGTIFNDGRRTFVFHSRCIVQDSG